MRPWDGYVPAGVPGCQLHSLGERATAHSDSKMYSLMDSGSRNCCMDSWLLAPHAITAIIAIRKDSNTRIAKGNGNRMTIIGRLSLCVNLRPAALLLLTRRDASA